MLKPTLENRIKKLEEYFVGQSFQSWDEDSISILELRMKREKDASGKPQKTPELISAQVLSSRKELSCHGDFTYWNRTGQLEQRKRAISYQYSKTKRKGIKFEEYRSLPLTEDKNNIQAIKEIDND